MKIGYILHVMFQKIALFLLEYKRWKNNINFVSQNNSNNLLKEVDKIKFESERDIFISQCTHAYISLNNYVRMKGKILFTIDLHGLMLFSPKFNIDILIISRALEIYLFPSYAIVYKLISLN